MALQQQETEALAPVQKAIQANPATPDYLITQVESMRSLGIIWPQSILT